MNTKLYLVRHAVTDANLNNIFLGKTDVKLSNIGLKQAKSLSKRLASEDNIDIIFSSNMKRTLQTAYYIGSQQGVPISISEDLREIDFGKWEGRTHNEVARKYPHEFLKWLKEQKLSIMLGGEDLYSFQQRLLRETINIVHKNKGKNICIVSHGACIKALMCYFKNYSLEQISDVPWSDNTAVNIVQFENNCHQVIKLSDNKHLTGDLNKKTYTDIPNLLAYAEKLVASSSIAAVL